MLKRGTKSEYILLASSFSVNVLGFSPRGILLAVVLLYIACIMLRYILCMSRFSSTFTIKENWILSEAFSESTWILCHFCPSVCLCGGLQSIIYFIIPVSFGWLLDHSGWYFGGFLVFSFLLEEYMPKHILTQIKEILKS